MICPKVRPAANNAYPHNFKTELCRSFEATGWCRYGNKCQYAHGNEDVRIKQKQNKQTKPFTPRPPHPQPSISHPPCLPSQPAHSISYPPCSPHPSTLSISYPPPSISYLPFSPHPPAPSISHSPRPPCLSCSPRSTTSISPHAVPMSPQHLSLSHLVGIAYYQPPLPSTKQLFPKTNMPDEPTAEDILEHLNAALENMKL